MENALNDDLERVASFHQSQALWCPHPDCLLDVETVFEDQDDLRRHLLEVHQQEEDDERDDDELSPPERRGAASGRHTRNLTRHAIGCIVLLLIASLY